MRHYRRKRRVYQNPTVTHHLVISRGEKTATRGKTKRQLFWKLFILFLVAIVFFLLGIRVRIWALRAPCFQSRITVAGNEFIKEEEIIRMAGINSGTNVFAVNRRLIQEKVFRHPRIKSVKIHYRPLNLLIIRVKEREAIACLGDKWEVDEEGKLFPRRKEGNSNLPVIYSRTDFSRGKSSYLLSILEILRYLNSRIPDLKIARIEVYNLENVSLFTQQDKIEIRLGGENLLSRLPLLLPVWQDLKQKGQTFRYIDLRFEGQVVVD